MHWRTAWLVGWTLGALVVSFSMGDTVFSHDLAKTLQGPSWLHPCGFDTFGRDLIPLVLHASLLSIAFSLLSVISSMALGVGIGGALAVAPPALRTLCLRALEGMLAFPSLMIALAWAAIRGPGWSTLIVALFLGTLPGLTRLLYLRAQEVLTEEYIEAAIGLGADRFRIFSRYVTPELSRLSAVKFPSLFAQTLLAEATLSFLGIGAPIGQDTWGSLLAQGKDYLIEAPHLAIATGIPLVITVLALQGISERWELIGKRALG